MNKVTRVLREWSGSRAPFGFLSWEARKTFLMGQEIAREVMLASAHPLPREDGTYMQEDILLLLS